MQTLVRSLKTYAIPRPAAEVIIITAFAAATALGAFVRLPIPGTMVPFTLQTYFVLFAALALGARRGTISQALYIVIGALGAPIFVGAGAGLLYFAGPTGGYLVGFVAATVIVGLMAGRSKTLTGFILAALVGTVTILTFGTLHLALVLGYKNAFMVGFVPFIAGDIVKAVLAAVCAWKTRKYLLPTA